MEKWEVIEILKKLATGIDPHSGNPANAGKPWDDEQMKTLPECRARYRLSSIDSLP